MIVHVDQNPGYVAHVTTDAPVHAKVDGYLPGGGGVTVEPLRVTENGVYTAPSDKAYSPVTVDVKGYSDDCFALKKYIQSDSGQEIDTGYINKENSRYELVGNFEKDGFNSYPYLFGLNAMYGILGKYSSSAGRIYFNASKYQAQDMAKIAYKKMVANFTSNYCSIEAEDGFRVMFGFAKWYETPENQASIKLFSGGTSSTRIAMKLYRFRIWEGDALVHEFVPWIDDLDVVCLRDTVTNELKYNTTGTRVFVYGEEADGTFETSGWIGSWDTFTEVHGNDVDLKAVGTSTRHDIHIRVPEIVRETHRFEPGDVVVVAFTVKEVNQRVGFSMDNQSNWTTQSATGLMTIPDNYPGTAYTKVTGSDVLTFTFTAASGNSTNLNLRPTKASDGSTLSSAHGKVEVTGLSFNGNLIFGSVTPPSS